MPRSRRRSDAAGQLSLPGFDTVPVPTDGLFFAVFPEIEAAARIEGLAQFMCGHYGLNGKPLLTHRFHITLCPLGTYAGGLPPVLVARAVSAARSVAMPSFGVAFDYV